LDDEALHRKLLEAREVENRVLEILEKRREERNVESKVVEEGDQLAVFADSDWANDVDSRRSQGVVLMNVNGTLDDEELDDGETEKGGT
jgi:hypothetical protein